jgi:FAD/FMN-containing dehydrogenase
VSGDKATASVGPGSRWGKVYREVEKFSRVAVGGRVGTVGVGGLTLGGGISSFSLRYGWTCDTVKNIEIVLADGKVTNANEQENSDLLHALRGASNNFGGLPALISTYTSRVTSGAEM